MTNSRAIQGGNLILLDQHKATGTETSYTYNGSLDMDTKYSEIIVIINGTATAALGIDMLINSLTDYNHTTIKADTTTLTTGLSDAHAAHHLLATSIIDGAVPFYSRTSITQLILADNTKTLTLDSTSSSPHEGSVRLISSTVAGSNPITVINIAVTTSSWAIYTEILVYGILR